jgi:hypothetical protein
MVMLILVARIGDDSPPHLGQGTGEDGDVDP